MARNVTVGLPGLCGLMATLMLTVATGCGASPDDDRPTEMVFYGDGTESSPPVAGTAAPTPTVDASGRSADEHHDPADETSAPLPGPSTPEPRETSANQSGENGETGTGDPRAAAADPSESGEQPRILTVSLGVTLTTFEMGDQFGRRHTIAFPTDRPMVIAVGDRDGSPQLDAWTGPLWERFGDAITIHGVALLASIDPLFRGFVAGVIRHQRPKRPVLLDWTGDVTRPLDCQQAVANVFVIDRTGRVRLQAIGKQTPQALDRLATEIDRLFAE